MLLLTHGCSACTLQRGSAQNGSWNIFVRHDIVIKERTRLGSSRVLVVEIEEMNSLNTASLEDGIDESVGKIESS
jgi:hypothetical protein